jgi:poly-gamma-glutamate capsule biosynthesis protein CapA/YwtB (metallophosphatase superfamily)
MDPFTLHLTPLGQALIQHDLRAYPWPDFAMLATMFARADVCFTDPETAIRSPAAEAPTRRGVFLHAADPEVLDCLKDLSISLLTTANNHAFDLGTGGINGAITELDARGFTHAGTGSDLKTATAPDYRRSANGRVALVAAASGGVRDGAAATATRGGVNELRRDANGILDAADVARITAAIAEAAHADIVLAYHHNHFFEEGGRRTPQWQRQFARQCVDAGASLYISRGAPRLHGIELYRGPPLFYDLGNLNFQTATEEGFYDDAVWQSVVAECRFAGGGLREMTLTPIQLNPQGVGGPGDLATRGRPSIARGKRQVQSSTVLPSCPAPSTPLSSDPATPLSSLQRVINACRIWP